MEIQRPEVPSSYHHIELRSKNMVNSLQPPVAQAQMLIRRPVAEVFEAFINPAVTSRFWFSKSTGPLVPGRRVRWDWEMYGASANVDVQEVEQNRRIFVQWNGPDNPSLVEWTFEPMSDGTFVVVRNWAFRGDANKVVAEAIASTSGFSFVLAALKAFAEHGLALNVVGDHNPAARVAAVGSHRHA
jgi:uncharacterized protein YndB with AHSA1/START domain